MTLCWQLIVSTKRCVWNVANQGWTGRRSLLLCYEVQRPLLRYNNIDVLWLLASIVFKFDNTHRSIWREFTLIIRNLFSLEPRSCFVLFSLDATSLSFIFPVDDLVEILFHVLLTWCNPLSFDSPFDNCCCFFCHFHFFLHGTAIPFDFDFFLFVYAPQRQRVLFHRVICNHMLVPVFKWPNKWGLDAIHSLLFFLLMIVVGSSFISSDREFYSTFEMAFWFRPFKLSNFKLKHFQIGKIFKMHEKGVNQTQ